MGCGGMGGCGDSGNKFSGHKTSNHSTKTVPNWGMTKKPASSTQSRTSAGGGFGTPKVKMSFGRKR